jgi:hypothetical protein
MAIAREPRRLLGVVDGSPARPSGHGLDRGIRAHFGRRIEPPWAGRLRRHARKTALTLPPDAKVTTEILWRATLIFAPIDAVFISILAWRIDTKTFRSFKRMLIVTTAVFWFAMWLVMTSGLFWDSVYHYVFPAWARWLIPPVYGLLFGAVALLFWHLALGVPGRPVVTYCLLGGLWGSVTHVWAIWRGILEKPPMLRGASPVAAVVFPFFEFVLYWCITVTVATLAQRITSSAKGR